ncbi:MULTISPECIES: CDP-alcohol phosphatidyltransferase family protein [Tritonibacter]|uniref:CDP-diacylglycerol--serine O-phosphatidyltransferase n=1 Tax=Tritonibacter scottomollicae TaxID=483013 RepID=A0A2T1A8R1_TRISK|nr:phosphatidylcholine/phosphatidylserine synthase [Tritonibacter scottomollicae]PRZ44934.1 CDP-diacylglycerol--serine O-phosphatidyltransferase [Tritonibacter scottomollicae]WOI32808.1 phosphatidylcholine/phosphatidylserine synthase [Tritonibacter scottomollicae]
MPEDTENTSTHLTIVQLIPNMLTIAAICAGLSAIRFGVEGNYVLAVQLILAACVLDGLDGRLARLLNSDSKMGAELDSLADFLNFGVAPVLVIYFWALQDLRGVAWITVLIFATCCVVRLARFNVAAKADSEEEREAAGAYFSGIPSPAGALLAMLPMFLSFAFADARLLPDLVICLHLILVGWAMIARFPVWSFKTARISRNNVKFFLVGFAVLGSAVLIYAWITLVVLCLAYLIVVIWSVLSHRMAEDRKGH